MAAILACLAPVSRKTRLKDCTRCKQPHAATLKRCPICGLLAPDEDDASDPNDPRWQALGGRSPGDAAACAGVTHRVGAKQR